MPLSMTQSTEKTKMTKPKLTPEDWEYKLEISENVLNSFSSFYGTNVEELVADAKRRRIHTIYKGTSFPKREHPGYEWCELSFKTTPKCEFSCGSTEGVCQLCDRQFFRENKEMKWKVVKGGMGKLFKLYCKNQKECDKLDWAIAVLSEPNLWKDYIVENALLFIDGKVKLEAYGFPPEHYLKFVSIEST